MILHYKLWSSEAEKAKLVLLHGMGGTGALWRPIAAGLESDISCLAPDQRGHGGSKIAAPSGGRERVTYTPLDYGRDVLETIESLAFEPAFLLGHSMGVRTACAVAHLSPDSVSGLILIDLGFSGPAGGGLGDGLEAFLKILPPDFESRAAMRFFLDEQCPDPSIAQYLAAVSYTEPVTLRQKFPFDHSALIQTLEAARLVSVRPWIEAFAASGKPIGILRGAESGVWSREEYEKERSSLARFKNVIFEEMPGAGHGLPFEKRVEFVAKLRAFLGAL